MPIIQRYLIFYKADDDKHEIMIYAIVDARQQYLNLV